jgi:hypothetical protein
MQRFGFLMSVAVFALAVTVASRAQNVCPSVMTLQCKWYRSEYKVTAVDLTEAPDVSITPGDNCADAINGLLSPPRAPQGLR